MAQTHQRCFAAELSVYTLYIMHTECQNVGLAHLAQHSGCLGVVCENGQTYLGQICNDHSQRELPVNTPYL